MLENVLVKSEGFKLKKMIAVLLAVATVLSVIIFIVLCEDLASYYDYERECYLSHSVPDSISYCNSRKNDYELCESCQRSEEFFEKYPSKVSYFFSIIEFSDFIEFLLFSLIPVAAIGLICALICLWLRSYELTVTDKRIYGKVAFGKRVDLPVDSVSATSTIQLLKGVAVSTSSGKISFLAIKNADEIYSIINELLVKRQESAATKTETATETKLDETEQILKYKDLLDKKIITQEEFDAKKKQILGL